MLSSATARVKWMTPSAPGGVVSTPTSSAFRHLRASPSLVTREVPQRLVIGLHAVLAQAALGVGQRAAHEADEALRRERLELENLGARDQRAVDVKERIVRRRADQPDDAALDIRQQDVLLGFVEPVDFVDEENRPDAAGLEAIGRAGDHAAHVRHAALDPAESLEPGLRGLGDNLGQRRLARAGRPEEDDR